jgi:thiol-disulfide isomerase/thioredoxin
MRLPAKGAVGRKRSANVPGRKGRKMARTRQSVSWLVLSTAVLCVGSQSQGAEPSVQSGRNSAGLSGSAAGKDPFAVPDLKPPELLKWIQKGEKYEPQVTSQEELIDFMKKSRHAIAEAADKILAAKTNNTIRFSAIKSKTDALLTLEKYGDPDVLKIFKDFVEQIKDEKQAGEVHLAKCLTCKIHLIEAGDDPAALGKAWGELKREFAAASNDHGLLEIAIAFASGIERRMPDFAPKILSDTIGMIAAVKDPKLDATSKKFEAVVRRLTLLGKQLEIKGTLLDGKPFDQGSLQGKVVLLDFWATWCPPCRQELPNVKANYEKYHDKGFEIIGVSLDADFEDLQKFLADEKITWPILFPKDKKEQYWNHPLAVYYAVNAIPTAILTNQKGEVIALNVHGPELGRHLQELLGKAATKTGQ